VFIEKIITAPQPLEEKIHLAIGWAKNGCFGYFHVQCTGLVSIDAFQIPAKLRSFYKTMNVKLFIVDENVLDIFKY
jgi:hypothetical protein